MRARAHLQQAALLAVLVACSEPAPSLSVPIATAWAAPPTGILAPATAAAGTAASDGGGGGAAPAPPWRIAPHEGPPLAPQPPLPKPPGDADVPVGPKPRPARPRAQARRAAKPAVVGVLNVNRATEAELRLLPGIGRTRAATIVERRKRRPFASLDELARIRGLKSIVRRLRPHLSLSGDSTLRPAPATRPPTPPPGPSG